MSRSAEPSIGTLLLAILGFAALGTPMFLYLWETVNALLTGHVDGGRVLAALPVLALFTGLLALMRRVLGRWAPTPG